MQLHFDRALELLSPYSPEQLGFAGVLLKARILRGTYAYRSALKWAQTALSMADTTEDSARAMIEQAKCFFALNQSEEALQILKPLLDTENQNSAFYPLQKEAAVQTALICSETGKVDEALDILEEFTTEEELKEAPEEAIRKAVDILCLQGDLFSYKSSMPGADQAGWASMAEDSYQQAMQTCLLLQPSPFASLRMALIYNNRADLYEGLERFDEAGMDYETALNLADAIHDEDLFDLNGYKADLLMSMGNFFALKDSEAAAMKFLQLAKEQIEGIHNAQQESYLAKCYYLMGLCRLYSEEDRAVEDLENSVNLYQKLIEEGRDKEERLANAEFYLAGALSDTDENLKRKRTLYKEALPVFQRIWQRNPELYLANMAALYNDLGRICYFEEDPDQAVCYYNQALEQYHEIVTLNPDDLFALLNLAVTRLNLVSAAFRIPEEDISAIQLDKALKELESLAAREEEYAAEIWSLLAASRDTLLEQLPAFADRYNRLMASVQPAQIQA